MYTCIIRENKKELFITKEETVLLIMDINLPLLLTLKSHGRSF